MTTSSQQAASRASAAAARAAQAVKAEERYQAFARLLERRFTPAQAAWQIGVTAATGRRYARRYHAERKVPDG